MQLNQSETNKVVVDDFIEYRIFLRPQFVDEKADTGISHIELLNVYRAQMLDVLERDTKDYFWHVDAFELHIWSETDAENRDDFVDHLYGRVRVGDNIEDEWFIVYLLYQISKTFSDVAICAQDSDEQFMLIEAADSIPDWLSPDNSPNRVWIYQNALHIIPLPTTPAMLTDCPVKLNAFKAVKTLTSGKWNTLATAGVQEAIRKRIDKFPQLAWESNRHTVRMMLPLRAAQVLKESPHLVTAAARAFYYRDTLQLKAAAPMKQFGPGSEPRVSMMVRIPRCAYAMILQQSWHPPAVLSNPIKVDVNFKATDLGGKLAVGLEILYQDSERRSKRKGAVLHALDDGVIDDKDPGWVTYRESLKRLDYFRGEMQGSTLWKQLEAQAKQHYVTSKRQQTTATHQIDERDLFADEIDKLLSKPFTSDDFPVSKLTEDSSDSWMQISEEAMEEMLRGQQGLRGTAAMDGSGTESKVASDMEEIVGRFSKFVTQMSDFEGVELPSSGEDMNLDPQKFMKALMGNLGVKSDGGDDDMFGEEDYEMGDDDSEDSDNYDGKHSDNDEERQFDEADGDSDLFPSAFDQAEFMRRLHGMAPKPSTASTQPKPVVSSGASQQPKLSAPASASSTSKTGLKGGFFNKPAAAKPKRVEVNDGPSMKDLMEEMDRELSGTAMGKTFKQDPREVGVTAGVNDDDNDEPLNIDMNLVSNLLKSYGAQQGLSGPVSNMLGALGLQLPDNADEFKE